VDETTKLDPPKVVIKSGALAGEYPLPLPLVPTYREANLIKRVTGLTIGQLIARFMADDPDADVGLVIFALKRARPNVEEDDIAELYDLDIGSLEIVLVAEQEAGDRPPAPSGGEAPSEGSSAAEPPSSPSDTPETPEETGTP
jgi:hypothetical protein